MACGKKCRVFQGDLDADKAYSGLRQMARMPFTTGRRIEVSAIVVVLAISFPAELWKDMI